MGTEGPAVTVRPVLGARALSARREHRGTEPAAATRLPARPAAAGRQAHLAGGGSPHCRPHSPASPGARAWGHPTRPFHRDPSCSSLVRRSCGLKVLAHVDKVLVGTVCRENWYGSSAHGRGRTFLQGSERPDRTAARRHMPAAITLLPLGLRGVPPGLGTGSFSRVRLPQDRGESEISRGPGASLRQRRVEASGEGLRA